MDPMDDVIQVNIQSYDVVVQIMDSYFIELTQKVLERWCDENCEGIWLHNIIDHTYTPTLHKRQIRFQFELASDAMAFKLKWSE
jgi:hypothetical protein